MKGKLISIKLQRLKYVVLDWATSMFGFFVFNLCRYYLLEYKAYQHSGLMQYLTSQTLVMEQILVPVVMVGVFWLSGYYNHPFNKSRLSELLTTFLSTLFNTTWIYLTMLINDQMQSRSLSYELILMLFACLFTFTYIGRLTLTQQAIKFFMARKWSFNTIMAGESDRAIDMATRIANQQAKLGYNIVAHLPLAGETPSTRNHATIDIDRLKAMCINGKIDQIIIAPEVPEEKKILYLIYDLLPLGVPIRLAPTALTMLSSAIRQQDVYAEPFLDISTPGVSEFTKNLKRFTDVVVSALAMLIISPLMLVMAILIKLTSKGPVIYSQERIGYHQKPFKIYKFRSMVVDAEKDGPQLSDGDDPRITPLGHFMRKYRIDELPQFWNVFKGDMSLVGPRPERKYFIDKIVMKAPYYTLLHQVRPGLTSWGMVKFGYAKTVDEMLERTRYDLIYLSNMSTIMDLKIMIHTVKTVLSGEGL